MRKTFSVTNAFAVGALLGVGLLAGLCSPASANKIVGYTFAPNWALGSPQRPFIAGCSDVDPAKCSGHLGLGGLSDVLDYRNVGQFSYIEAAMSENQTLFALGRRASLNEANGDWWDLIIPTARWVGLGNNGGLVFFLRDGDEAANVVGDAIAYVNVNGGAHIYWWSNNSTNPDTSQVPSDFLVSSFFDVFVDLSSTGGTFDNSNTPPPNDPNNPTGSDMAQCTPGDPVLTGCMAANADLTVATVVPEPGSLSVVVIGLFGVAIARRRTRKLRHG